VVFYHLLIFLEYNKPPSIVPPAGPGARLSLPQKLSTLHARHVSKQPFKRQASCHNKLTKVRIANGQTVRFALFGGPLRSDSFARDPKRSQEMLEELLLGVVVLGLDEEICKRSGHLRGALRNGGQIIGDFDLRLKHGSGIK
jgi:predicted nucleic acid-binding protein